jgi:hypothetical protein
MGLTNRTRFDYDSHMPPKRPSSVRLSDQAKALIEQVARELGLTRSGALELLIRRGAEIELKKRRTE